MTDDPATPRGTVHWTRGILAGAVAGGIGWGLLAAATIGAPGNEAHLNATITPNLTVAVTISVLCLLAASGLGYARRWRTAAVALAVAPTSGWVILALGCLQTLALRP